PIAQVPLAVPGVDQRAVGVARHRVDREVATPQVVFERDIGRELHDEAAVAAARLALGASQRVFLARVGVQEDREVPADGLVALRLQFSRRGAAHHPVAVADRQPEQLAAYRSADAVDLHSLSLYARALSDARGCG